MKIICLEEITEGNVERQLLLVYLLKIIQIFKKIEHCKSAELFEENYKLVILMKNWSFIHHILLR